MPTQVGEGVLPRKRVLPKQRRCRAGRGWRAAHRRRAYGLTTGLPAETTQIPWDGPAALVEFVAGTDAVTLLSPVTLSTTDASRVSAVPLRDRELRQRALQVQCRVDQPQSIVLEAFIERIVAALEAEADSASRAP